MFPQTKEQRCWWYRIGNVLAPPPKSTQPGAKAAMAEIYNAQDRTHTQVAAKAFAIDYGAKWPKDVAKITDELDTLLAFHDFPAKQWIHLRTTNLIESTFATVRLRQRVTKGPGSERPASRWRSSSSRPPRPAGAPPARRTSLRSSAPAQPSPTAPSNDPTNQEPINKSRDAPIHRS